MNGRDLPQRRYMPGLDGLRALAVIAVILYHLNSSWLPGGFLGVAVFFTLSGYLITDILANEWIQKRSFDMKRFWLRRARRLLPAMLAVIAVILAASVAMDPSRFSALRGDVPAALLYASNWWFIAHQVSYFESFGPPSPLGHLWSLAVEEQFYLIWPLLLLLGFKSFSKMDKMKRRKQQALTRELSGQTDPLDRLGYRFGERATAAAPLDNRKLLAGCIMGLALISALLMAVIYVPGSDPSRVYYGTDTRGFALLTGAALAIVLPSSRFSANTSKQAKLALDIIGIACLAGFGYFIRVVSEYDAFLYRGGLLLIALLTTLLVVVLAHPAAAIGKLLGAWPLRWIGTRSYGLYLWHFPVIVLTTPQVDTDGLHLARTVLQLAATFLIAGISYKFLEQPIRQHGFLAWIRHGYTNKQGPSRRWNVLSSFVAMLLFAGILSGCVNLYNAPTERPAAEEAAPSEGEQTVTMPQIHGSAPASDAQASLPASGNVTGSNTGADSPVGPAESHAAPPTPSPEPPKSAVPVGPPQGAAASGQPGAGTSQTPEPSGQTGNQPGSPEDEGAVTMEGDGEGITAIGDSVMLDVEPYLQKALPKAVINGKVGRQMAEAPKLIEDLQKKGKLGTTVIIELGTNGAFSKSKFQSLLKQLKDVKHILLVNTRVPRAWEEQVNKTLAGAASKDPRITLVDWYGTSEDQTGYFAKDGVHLKSDGAKAYTAMLIKALSQL